MRDTANDVHAQLKALRLNGMAAAWADLNEQTTVANLFYNMGARKVGLVGLWDVVAFDEVAGINFKDHDSVQIMKDYMASGSFSRGRESISAGAAMVFVGNLPQGQSVESLVKTSYLFAPFPDVMIDSAFFDRFHAYVPGWELPKMRSEFFTNQYGLIVDYLAEWAREMRKRSFADAIDRFFKLGNNLNQRDSARLVQTPARNLLDLRHQSARPSLLPQHRFGRWNARFEQLNQNDRSRIRSQSLATTYS